MATFTRETAGPRHYRRESVDYSLNAILNADPRDDGTMVIRARTSAEFGTVSVVTKDYQYMAPESFHRPLPPNAALDSVDGPAAVAAIVARSSGTVKPRINAKQFSPTMFIVPADQPRVPIYVPSGWAPKRAIFQIYGVPIDVDAYIEIYNAKKALQDTDLSCVVTQPDYVSFDGRLLGREWGMWRLEPTTTDEFAATGCRLKFNDRGCYRITGLSTSLGYTVARPHVSAGKLVPLDQPGWKQEWGSGYPDGFAPPDNRLDQLETWELRSGYQLMSASGLALGPFTFTIEDAQRGIIDHAISFGIGSDLVRPGARWPAQASDGAQAGAPIAEGMRFRFPVDLDFAPYNLSPLGLMWAKAVQHYGLFPVDRSNAGGILASSAQWGVEALFPRVPRGAKDELMPFHSYPGSAAYDAQGEMPWDKLQLCAAGTPTTPVPLA